MAEQYFARWGDDPRPQVRAAAHTLFGVDEWTRGLIGSAMGHLDEAAALLAGARLPRTPSRAGSRVIAHSFGLYCHAAHGDQTPEEALVGFDFMLGIVPPAAVPAVCAFGAAVAAVHTRWDAVDRLVRRALELDPASQFAFFGGQLLMFRGARRGAQRRLRHRDRQLCGGPLEAALHRRSLRNAELSGAARRAARPGGRVNDAAELVAGARLQTDEIRRGLERGDDLHRRRCGGRRFGQPGARRRAAHHGSRHRQGAGRRRARRASRGHPRSAAGRLATHHQIAGSSNSMPAFSTSGSLS